MAGDGNLPRSRSDSGHTVPHEGKMVFDVTTWKWYEVRDSYRLGHRSDVQLQPPGGYDTRHVSTDQFTSEIGSRLLLKTVTRSLADADRWPDAVGDMAHNVFTNDFGIPDDALTCPDCGHSAADGYVRLLHDSVRWDDPEGPTLHCRDCRANWGVRRAVIDL